MKDSISYPDNYYHNDPDSSHTWKLQFNQYHFANDTEITGLINKLIRICSSTDLAKNIYADLSLKELLIRLVQSQYLMRIRTEAPDQPNQTRLHSLLHYIHEHLIEKISIDILSRKAYMNRNEFFKWFKE